MDATVRLGPWKDLGWNSWNINQTGSESLNIFSSPRGQKIPVKKRTQENVTVKHPVHLGGCLTTRRPGERAQSVCSEKRLCPTLDTSKHTLTKPTNTDTFTQSQTHFWGHISALRLRNKGVKRAVSGWDKKWVFEHASSFHTEVSVSLSMTNGVRGVRTVTQY